jgi:hypothetical protein
VRLDDDGQHDQDACHRFPIDLHREERRRRHHREEDVHLAEHELVRVELAHRHDQHGDQESRSLASLGWEPDVERDEKHEQCNGGETRWLPPRKAEAARWAA